MQVTFSDPIQSIRGTLDKESGTYFTTRNGKTFLCFRRQSKRPTPKATSVSPDIIRQSSKSVLHRQRFTKAQSLTSEIMAAPNLKRHYESLWRNQHRYPTLRGFIFAQMMQMCK